MVCYQDIGLENTNTVLISALQNNYAVPAYNFSNLEQLQAIMFASAQTASPVILQVTQASSTYINPTILRHLVEGAVKMARDELCASFPVALHLDHGQTFEECQRAIESGYSSVMLDTTKLSFKIKVKETKKLVDFAHQHNVSVEGVLGTLTLPKNASSTYSDVFTNPDAITEYVMETGVDSLAISIGTSHGMRKCISNPRLLSHGLNMELLDLLHARVPDIPFVLHGCSSLPGKYTKKVNAFGGSLSALSGVKEELLSTAARSWICKINIDTDIRLMYTSSIRQHLYEFTYNIDPRKYQGTARDQLVEFLVEKNKNIMHSNGKG